MKTLKYKRMFCRGTRAKPPEHWGVGWHDTNRQGHMRSPTYHSLCTMVAANDLTGFRVCLEVP